MMRRCTGEDSIQFAHFIRQAGTFRRCRSSFRSGSFILWDGEYGVLECQRQTIAMIRFFPKAGITRNRRGIQIGIGIGFGFLP